MAGSKAGAQKARQTIRNRHGAGFYAKVGALGGKAPTKKPKGFASMSKEAVSAAGRKGGSMGKKRPGSKLSPETLELIRLQQIHWERSR